LGLGFGLGRGWIGLGSGWAGLGRSGWAWLWVGLDRSDRASSWAGVGAGVGSGRARPGLGQVGLQALGWVGFSPSWVGPGFGQFWLVGLGLALGWLLGHAWVGSGWAGLGSVRLVRSGLASGRLSGSAWVGQVGPGLGWSGRSVWAWLWVGLVFRSGLGWVGLGSGQTREGRVRVGVRSGQVRSGREGEGRPPPPPLPPPRMTANMYNILLKCMILYL